MRWNLRTHTPLTSLDAVHTALLKHRSVSNTELFFSPPHPSTLSLAEVGLDPSQVDAAVDRIRAAQTNGERVLVFGDYDADGICATTVLWKTLSQLGCTVHPFIPNRQRHGYGITLAALDDALSDGAADLIITVDNGIVALPVLQTLQERGVDVIVTDHHQPEKNTDGTAVLPPAHSVVHTTQLCGTSVAWMLARELDPAFAEQLVEFCAIATVADLVPLTGANRSFVFHGLKQLQNTENIGLQALAAESRINLSQATVQTIGFSIAPRMNAMGRLADGLDALRLLCTQNHASAKRLAHVLYETNGERQVLTQDLLAIAQEQVSQMGNEPVLIVHSEAFHEGVVGLIAGRLTEQYHKPAIAISLNERTGKASARSIEQVNIIDLIREIREELLEAGGHPLAAGFGFERRNLNTVLKRLSEVARMRVTPAHLERTLELEGELTGSLLNLELTQLLDTFEPFGRENERPIFALRKLRVIAASTVGAEGKHLRLALSPHGQQASHHLTALFWNSGHRIRECHVGTSVDVAAAVEENNWKNRRSVQLILKDIRAAD